jgi:uncharacterized membrane protein YjgN (DUF898 family)
MVQWFYATNGESIGPVSAETVRGLESRGVLNGTSMVWCEGLAAWTPLGLIPEHLLPGGAVAPPTMAANLPLTVLPEQAHAFEFRGRTSEFFRIWIVNVVLTLLTFGIYAAWAKVRTRRYFYGNTLLDGKPFDFTANPIAILKGNLIFGVLFILYTVAGAVFPPLALLVILVIAGLAPWLIYKAIRFRAHHTVHRNVRFGFRGTPGAAYAVFLGLPILVGVTLGIFGPYMQFRQRKYFLGNLAWGRAEAAMRGGAGFFYKTFLKVVGVIMLLALLSSLLAAPVLNMIGRQGVDREGGAPAAQIEANVTDGQVEEDPTVEQEPGLPGGMEAAVLLATLTAYLLFFLVFVYYQVRTQNYCLNTTHWGDLGRLDSRVRVRDLLWLYLSNGVAVLLSLGLLIPWVKIRMARYRAERTTFLCAGSLDAVTAGVMAEESALGDAGADVFDFDIGF